MLDWDIDPIRVLLSFLAGYFICLSGSLTQIVTQNPLASPSTLGLNGMVVFCVLIAHALLVYLSLHLPLEYCSMLVFALLCLGIFLFFKIQDQRRQNQRPFVSDMRVIILGGLGINLLVGAIFSVMQFLFMSMNVQFPTGLWFGNFRYASLDMLGIFAFVFLLCLIMVQRLYRPLRIISVGSMFAYGLGINVLKVQRRALYFSLLLTCIVISFFGVFSFLGLILPHIIRRLPLIDTDIKKELMLGPYLSGIALMILDYACYNFPLYGAELPVGMVSSVLGSVILLALLWSQYHRQFENV